ncbi:MAG: tRNA (cytidine(34)-2'-O)-methyltransferase [Catonella sp.]|uniref:tRNA (cytidine(34)-2'-O)-methyltransferase n=1 Tax=Catonella sp. TaxID=2382125 RepID=UPI003FA1588A
MMNIVLHEPEIPANTGNIGRTCVATGTTLHLIKPLGFDISDKRVRRAGMDYWKDLDLYVYENFSEFIARNPNARIYMATTKAKKAYTEVEYNEDDFIMFGKESAGIPEEILIKYEDTSVRIPMIGEIRSLNLSNSVAIMLYEALRQQDFEGMKLKGDLHRLKWSH